MIARTEAICLRIAPYSRTSHVVTWLTPEYGPLATAIKGSCRPKSPFLGQYDLFYSCELLFYRRERGGLHIARECTPLQTRDGLRGRWKASGAASYLCEICVRCVPAGVEASGPFELLRAALDGLCGGADPLVLLLWFELRFLVEVGLAPQLTTCPECRTSGGPAPRFSLGAGRFVCPHAPASGPVEDTVALSPRLLDVLRSWLAADASELPADPPDTKTMLGLRRFLGMFFTFHLDVFPEARTAALEILDLDPQAFARRMREPAGNGRKDETEATHP